MVYNKKTISSLPGNLCSLEMGLEQWDRISYKRASWWQVDCEGAAGTCLEAVFCIVNSLFSLRPEGFSRDAFIHSLTN